MHIFNAWIELLYRQNNHHDQQNNSVKVRFVGPISGLDAC